MAPGLCLILLRATLIVKKPGTLPPGRNLLTLQAGALPWRRAY
jgi:hypothetical protein